MGSGGWSGCWRVDDVALRWWEFGRGGDLRDQG
jgi:hypothetical protein